MTPAFDLFREDADGTVHWLCACPDPESAKQQLQELMLPGPAKYFVFSQASGTKTYLQPRTPLESELPATRRLTAEYNLFECLPDGSVRWRAAATGLIKTRRKLRELVEKTSGEYFAIQLPSRAVIFHAEAPALGKRIFQIAYTPDLCKRRQHVLCSRGYGVLSVVGSSAAKKLLMKVQFRADDIALFMIGHAAPEETRKEMAQWLKAKYPVVKVMALNPPDQELSVADINVPQNGPETWLPLLPANPA